MVGTWQNRGVTVSRPNPRRAIHLALVGLVLASALVAVGAHEHELWRGDAPESIYCVVDHAQLVGEARSSRAGETEAPELSAAERGHRHVCVGLHAAAQPPVVHRDLTPHPLAAPSRSLASATASSAEQRGDLALPGPRGPPAV